MSSYQQDKEKFREALNSLNNTQRESVLSDATSLQILAGPGSGKTRVLTFRVAYLVIEKNINPSEIIVVTFTTKAANEMKMRLIKLIGQSRTRRLIIGTFHAICSRLLHQYAEYAGLDPKFTICDTDQSKDIIHKIQKDKKVELNDFTRNMKSAALFGIISKEKNKGIDHIQYKQLYGEEWDKKYTAVVFELYELELDKQNLVDFDNLMLKTCVLLKVKKDVLARVKAILVDEYQDTNIVQYDLIKLMTNQVNSKSVTIVGDPDQSIFGWRMAEPKNFKKMSEEFKNTCAINMEQNYRSTSKVIDAAMHVITQDSQRVDKSLYTNNPEGIPMALIATHDEKSEAEFVAAEIHKAIRYSKGLIQYKDIAVLMRMNFISQQFENVFRKQKIPFTMVGGDRFFDRVEVKDMTMYLLFSYNPKNVTAFARIINVPRRGIGDVWMKRIMETNLESEDDMLETLTKIISRKTSIKFTPAIINKLRDLVQICEHVRSMIDRKEEVTEMLKYLYEATKYFDYLKEHYFNDHESRWQNLGELLNIAKRTRDEAASKPSENFYDQNGFEDSEMDSDIDMDSDFSDIDIDRYKKPEKKEESKASGSALQIEYPEDHIKNEDSEFSIHNETKSKTTGKGKSGKSTKVKNEPSAKFEPMEDEFVLDDIEIDNDDGGVGPELENENDEDDFGDLSLDPIQEFLEYCSLCSNVKEQEEAENDGGKVTIATMHSSKGLEWPCVFVVTCCEGVIPHSRCETTAEEGRLLYVAMTRSKFLLYCSAPKQRDMWGQRQREDLSHFLRDMKPELYTRNPPDWDSDMRTILAETIGRPIPERDEKLTTRKKSSSRYSSSQSSSQEYSDSQTFSSSQSSQGYSGRKTYDTSSQAFQNSQTSFTGSEDGLKYESEPFDVRFGVNGSQADLKTFGGFASASSLYKPHTPYKSSKDYKAKKEKSNTPLFSNPMPPVVKSSKKAKVDKKSKKESRKKDVDPEETEYVLE